MNNNKSEHVVFEVTTSCAVLAAGTAFAAVLYQLITSAMPLLESMLRLEMLSR